jgi:hypothetical protein
MINFTRLHQLRVAFSDTDELWYAEGLASNMDGIDTEVTVCTGTGTLAVTLVDSENPAEDLDLLEEHLREKLLEYRAHRNHEL